MLFYATCNELEQKIINSKDNKEKFKYGAQIEKLGLNSLLKYINSLENEALTEENRKIIKSMFRVPLIHGLIKDSIDQVSVINFLENLNDRKARTELSDEEYAFTYQICSEYSLTTKIIQPTFEPQDIIYLFFKYNENNEYIAGPIFDGIPQTGVKMNNIFKEVLDYVNKKNLDNMCDISVISAQILYKEFMKKYDEELENDYDKLCEYFKSNLETMKSEIEKNQLKAIINGMKIAKYFDGIIKANKKKTQKTMNFDDMMIFKKNNNKKFEIESILLENINPCFKFYIVKNLQLLESLINSKLNNDNFKELFNQSGECFIPFWVFLIRNMSSLNCVCYDNEKNPFSDEITKEVRKKIKDLLKDGENKKLDNGWLNLIVNDIPNKKININILFFL